MSINGVNNFKVNTVSNPADDVKAQTTDSTDPYVDDFFEQQFGDTAAQEVDTSSESDPLGDYMLGESSGTSGVPEFAPPAVDDIVMDDPDAVYYLDILEKKYIQYMDDLAALKESYQDAMNSGELTAEESLSLIARVEQIDIALSESEKQLERLYEVATETSNVYLEEARLCKDINNDGWIMRPRQEGSIYIYEKDDGSIIYLDHTGKPTTLPIMDPDYQACFSASDTMEVVDQNDPYRVLTHAYPGGVDCVLGFTQASLAGNGNQFGCEISLGVPRAFWVRRDSLEADPNNSDFKYDLYDEWNGLTQCTPADLSEYEQMRVTDMEVVSKPVPGHVSGHPNQKLYEHYVVYKNGDDVIARIQIVGFQSSDDTIPSNTPMNDGVSRVVPSSVGFEIIGDNQHVRIDCSQMESTSHHIVPNLHDVTPAEQVDGDSPGAIKENIGYFTQKDWLTTHYDPDSGEWVDNQDPGFDDGSYAHGSYNSRYWPITKTPADEVHYSSYATGVFVSGVCGEVTGTKHNDLIQMAAVNDLSEYDKAHLPEDQQTRMPGDPLYYNFVDCTGGNDVVFVSEGETMVKGATYVKATGMTDKSVLQVNFPERPTVDQGYAMDTLPNQKCYFSTDGGENWVYNPIEGNQLEDQQDVDGDDEPDPDAYDPGYSEDDLYVTDQGGITYFGNAGDANIDGPHGTTKKFDDVMLEDNWNDVYNDWYDTLTGEADAGELDEAIISDWDEVMNEATILDEEMDGFFDELFDLNSFQESL